MMQFNKEINEAYEADEGALTIAQLTQIIEVAPMERTHYCSAIEARNEPKTRGVSARISPTDG